MMSQEDAIQHLSDTMPETATTSHRQKLWGRVRDACAVIAVAAFIIGLFNLWQVAKQATCTNASLGYRQTSSVANSEAQLTSLQAQRDWWQSVYNAIIQAPAKTTDEREARSHKFNAEFRGFLDTLNAQISAQRTALNVQRKQPLGKC